MAIDIQALLTLKDFPQWFYLATNAVQFLGIIVSFFISYLGFKAYKITGDKKYKYFFYGFLFLGLSFLANITLNVLIRLGFARYFVERRYDLYIAPFFLIYYFFLIGTMLAYVSLSIVYANIKKMNKVWIWLFYFWTLVVGAYTFRDEVLFNMFSAVLLSFVVILTYEKYKEGRNRNRLLTVYAFLFIFLFHVLILVQQYIVAVFILRYVLLLVGLILLLVTLLKIYGGKKK